MYTLPGLAWRVSHPSRRRFYDSCPVGKCQSGLSSLAAHYFLGDFSLGPSTEHRVRALSCSNEELCPNIDVMTYDFLSAGPGLNLPSGIS